MAKRISELPTATEVADLDELELNQTGASRKATRAQLVTGLAPAAHTHSLAEVTDSGALAAKDMVATDDVEGGAIHPAKTYWGNGSVPPPVDGVSTLTLDPAVLMYLANDPSMTVVRIDDPPSGRPVLISNLTGQGIEIQDQGGGVIRPEVPHRTTLVLNRSGSIWQLLTEWSQRLHGHSLADITDSGALAAKDSVATADLADDAVSLAKMAHGTPDVLLGFDGSGAPAEITIGQGIDVVGSAIEADVASVFGRTGTVDAQAGDYDGLPLDLQDALLTRPKIQDYSETTTTPTITAGALTLDLEAGNVFDVVLTEDVTSISIVNAPASGSLGTITIRFRQDATGGRTVDLSGFDFGSAPTPAMPSTAATGRLWITALTLDGGAVWEAMAGFEKA